MSNPTNSDDEVIKKAQDGLLLRVRAITGAPRSGVRTVENGELRVAVHAQPDKGRANEEIITVLAHFFDTNKSRIAIVRGFSSRSKHVIIKELDHDLAVRKIRNL
jgi:uncharacterized protein (TIGR00251 family)